jgi:phosphatidylserine/phosphatidylglycerophosphate/cardiolipin synthase-like enzyme
MVVDDAWTLVGSMNWNANSVLNNREVSILVHDPESSALHARAFDTDWREAGPGGLGIPVAGAGPLLLVLAGLVLIRRVDAKRSYRRRP